MTETGRLMTRVPDRHDGKAYVLDPEVGFAVRVAIATGRPLLLRGEPGSGKSSLAAHAARQRKWRYYEHVVTSRTTARDLLWSFDAVRRLGDAQVMRHGERLNDSDYVEPGVLWWAFAPKQAKRRGADPKAEVQYPAVDPNPANKAVADAPAVVLIDEIDKADPDMPNGILVPLGSSEFEVADTRAQVRLAAENPKASLEHLIVITTNEERELPQALLRRCVVTWLPEPTKEHLVTVAEEHLRTYEQVCSPDDRRLAEDLAEEVIRARREAHEMGMRKPSTGEFLDALQAMRRLGVAVGDDDWNRLRTLTLLKQKPRR